MKGVFITFEGLDGSGKSTHLERADQMLRTRGYQTVVVREPGGTWIGERIRSILLDPAGHGMKEMAELLLFAAARNQITQEVIVPALAAGQAVLCDRFTDSTIAYQGYGRGLDICLVRRINDIATGGLTPDHTCLFDLPPEAAIARRQRRGGTPDRMETNGLAFARRVREGYLAIARQEPERILLLDASGSIAETAERLSQKLEEVLP